MGETQEIGPPKPKYEFTNEWFLGNFAGKGIEVDVVSIWRALFERYPISTVLEIGSYEGRSTVFIAETIATKNDLDIYCVDTWRGSFEHPGHDFERIEARFDNNISAVTKLFPSSLKIHKLKMTSIEACTALINEQREFDLVYIDGSHNASDVLADAVLSFFLLKPGGLMIFDDYLWTYGFQVSGNILNIPKLGIDAFVNCFQDKLKIIQGFPSYQLYCEKILTPSVPSSAQSHNTDTSLIRSLRRAVGSAARAVHLK